MSEEELFENSIKILRKYNGDGTITVKECVLKEEYDKLQQENKQLKEKVDYLKSKSENKDKWCQLIADIGYDYDGYRDVEGLMSLIDEIVRYSLYARDDYDYNTFQEEGNNE